MSLEKLVVARGAATTLVVSMPGALLNGAFASQDPKPQAAINMTYVLVLFGFVVGGFVAGSEAPASARAHALASVVAAFVPIEFVALMARLDRGDPISVPGIVVVGLFAAGLGALGARMGESAREKRNPS